MSSFLSNISPWIRAKADRLRFLIVAFSLLTVAYVGCFFLLIIRGENMFPEIPKLPSRRRFRKEMDDLAKKYADSSDRQHFSLRK